MVRIPGLRALVVYEGRMSARIYPGAGEASRCLPLDIMMLQVVPLPLIRLSSSARAAPTLPVTAPRTPQVSGAVPGQSGLPGLLPAPPDLAGATRPVTVGAPLLALAFLG